ncbi:MAG: hypothetical protein ACPHUL_00410 [Marinomonas gallaica]
MAKASKAYMGRNSNGFWVEYAQREDGQWFNRFEDSCPRYGTKTSKWEKCQEPKPATNVTNAYSGERVALEEGKFIESGFSLLERINGKLTYRLPNN